MGGDELSERLHRELIGKSINFTRMACDSLLLYLGGEPGDGRGLTLWLDPTWQLLAPEGEIAEARQNECEDGLPEAEAESLLELVCSTLVNRCISEVYLDHSSHDLTINVTDNFKIKTCYKGRSANHFWHIRENSTGLTLYNSSGGWMIRGG